MKARTYLIAAGILIACIYSYGFPLLISLVKPRYFQATVASHGGFLQALAYSGLYGFACSILACPVGFLLAHALLRAQIRVRKGLPFLMLPTLLGSAAFAFMFRRSIELSTALPESIADRRLIPTFGFLVLARAWQFAPLATFVFFMALERTSKARREYMRSLGSRSSECLRDLYLPGTRNTFWLCALLCFAISYSEYSLPHLLLKASPGTDSEMVAESVRRYYRITSEQSPQVGSQGVLMLSSIAGGVGAILAVLAAFASVGAVHLIVRVLPTRRRSLLRRGASPTAWATVVVGASILPLLSVFFPLPMPEFPSSGFLSQLAHSLGVGTLCAVLALAATFSGRVGLPMRFGTLNCFTTAILGGLFLWLVVPPSGLALMAHWWVRVLGGKLDSSVATLLWWLAELTLAFPVLAAFFLVTHFQVETTEIAYLRTQRASAWEMLVNSFIRRLWPGYLLLAFFATCLTWHESTVNSVLGMAAFGGDTLPLLLEGKIDGRSGNFESANWLILTSVLMLSVGIFLWSKLASRRLE